MSSKLQRKIHKYFEYVFTKAVLLFKQRKYRFSNVTLKYILERHKESSDLIVVFSSCTRRGIKARYNYMRSLSEFQVNKLFILDDFAKDKRGSYYLGPEFTFLEEKATISLVEMVEKNLCISGKKIFCGSSKGGYSALNFGLGFAGAYIIAGAPQYYLATYLKNSGNIECLNHIIGEETSDKLLKLDEHLKDKIVGCSNATGYHIYLNYSDKEHTYHEHIADLLSDLLSKKFSIKSKVDSFTDHSEISLYFPDFLRKTIEDILALQ